MPDLAAPATMAPWAARRLGKPKPATFDIPLPVVVVRSAIIAHIPIANELAVYCSECSEGWDDGSGMPEHLAWGVLTDDPGQVQNLRCRLQYAAKAHATEAHDGLVVAEGWAR